MALTATIYTLTIDLAHIDRGIYEALELRVARHPSESTEYMLARVLAYCLEYSEGIAFSQGIAAGAEPAVWIRDLTGAVQAWIEVGWPDAERLHRGSKQALRAAVYTHRDPTQLLGILRGKKIYRGSEIPIYAFDREFIATLAERLERRMSFSLSITEGQLYLELNGETIMGSVGEYRLED